MRIYRICVILSLLITVCFCVEPRKANLEPLSKIRGDEILGGDFKPTGYRGLSTSTREDTIIGTTAYDLQALGSFGQRIMLDSYPQAHINWMWQDYPMQSQRYCAWNARYVDSTYYGETQASNSWSGYVQLDITRDANPDSQRTVIAYHHDAGSGFYSWIDIDQSNLMGSWPNDPKTPAIADHIYPYVAVANNGNIVLATGDYNADILHLYLTRDEGATWSLVADFDSCACLSQFLRSSINTGSNKVVFVWTQFITDTIASGQLDNDVWYMLSEDGGETWGTPTNITNYQPADSVRAYCNVNAVFDLNDDLHIAWAGRRITDVYYEASKIFHWDEVSNTITIVSSPSTYYTEPGGWWIATSTSASPGAWRMPADQPQMTVSIVNGYLYCLWCGNDDYNDGSAGGYFNGEIFGSRSTDGGSSWSISYTNLTNTRSPGANPGECMDEDYLTVYPWCYGSYFAGFHAVYTYIEDKDAGAVWYGEGALTENPVHCYYRYWPGGSDIKEDNFSQTKHGHFGPTIISGPLFLSDDGKCRVFDITGRVVEAGNIKPGIYFIEIDGKITQKVVKTK